MRNNEFYNQQMNRRLLNMTQLNEPILDYQEDFAEWFSSDEELSTAAHFED